MAGFELRREPDAREVERRRPHGATARSGTLGSWALGLQRTAGNAATALAVQGIPRAGEGAGGGPLRHPMLAGEPRIVEAANGDVLKQGMRGDAVATMQEALEIVGHQPRGSKRPDGTFDGAWGGGTTDAVASFQAAHGVRPVGGWEAGPKTFRALDAALMKGGGGGGGGGGLVVPRLERFNPELEGLLDQVMIEYTRLLRAQSLAASEFELDLRDKTEKPAASLVFALLKDAAGTVFGKVYDATLPESVRNVIKFSVERFVDFPDKYKDTGIDAPIEAILKAAKSTVTGLPETPAAASLSGFIALHHIALVDATLALQEDFAARKKDLREPSADEEAKFAADPTGPDPRTENARRLLEAVRAGTARAKTSHYRETAQQWVIANAQGPLGKTGPSARRQHTHVADLRLAAHSGTHSVPGILELEFTYDQRRPEAAARLAEVAIAGLSRAARAKITKDDPTVKELGYPVRATGGGGFRPRISVASDETRSDFVNIDSSAAGIAYLEAKGGGRFDVGIERLLADLDRRRLGEVGGLKGPDD